MFDCYNGEHHVIELIADKPDEYPAVIDEISKMNKMVVMDSDILKQTPHGYSSNV